MNIFIPKKQLNELFEGMTKKDKRFAKCNVPYLWIIKDWIQYLSLYPIVLIVKHFYICNFMNDLILNFKNYAILPNGEYDLSDGSIFFVEAPNNSGKTTFLHALQALMEGKRR